MKACNIDASKYSILPMRLINCAHDAGNMADLIISVNF